MFSHTLSLSWVLFITASVFCPCTGEKPTVERAEEPAKDVRSEQATTSSPTTQVRRDDDQGESDEDIETYSSEGKGRTGRQSGFGQPVLGTGKPGAVPRKKSLPSLGISNGDKVTYLTHLAYLF